MTTTTPAAYTALLETARAAADAGDSLRARHYFRNATAIDPTNLEAWLGFAETTSVLRERRELYGRALALDPACREAHDAIAQIDALLATGALIRPRAAQQGDALPAVLSVDLPAPRPPATLRRRPGFGLVLVALTGAATMALLTTLGIFILTSFWGFLLAFLAGPMVSELMVRLTTRARGGLAGRPLQIACGLGMILGGGGALALGGLLLASLGAPLPVEAVVMARNSGVGETPTQVLLNNPGLLVFISSAVAATVYRLR